MKKAIALLSILYCIDSFAQIKSCNNDLIKEVIRNMYSPLLASDTCYHYSSLLVMKINNKSKITKLTFSDNAPSWMIERLELIKKQDLIKVDEINNILKKRNQKNITLAFPITYVLTSSCVPSRFEYYSSDDKMYFSVEGKLLSGNVQFCKPEVIGWQNLDK